MNENMITLPHRRDSLQLPDGRTLAWQEWGEDSGAPVLFCTGAGMSSSLPFGLEYLKKLNIRLISIDRPGLGKSDFHPEKSLGTWVKDIEFLLKTKSISRPRAVGFSQGAVFALALAAADLLHSVTLVSGQDEFSNPEIFSKLPKDVAHFVDRFRTHDKGFIEGFAQMADADGLWHLIKSMSTAKDRSYYESEPFHSAYLQCLREGFSKGSRGYVQDLEMTFAAWPFEIEKINTRVDLWYGQWDASTVHSPDFGVTLARRLPNNRHFLLSDEGGSLLWTQSERILTELLK